MIITLMKRVETDEKLISKNITIHSLYMAGRTQNKQVCLKQERLGVRFLFKKFMIVISST